MVTLGNLVKICIRTSNDATVPKITVSFCNIYATLVVGPIYWAIFATTNLRDHTILSWPTDSG